MRYDKIQKYFDEGEIGVTQLLKDCQEMFDTIDDYAAQFIGDILSASDELREAKTRLTGIVATLQPIYSKALSIKKQKEYRYYAEQKETLGTGFKDGATEKLSKDYVRVFRDLRDLLCGYIRSAEALIFDAKDRIEGNRREYSREKEEN